VNLTDGGGTRPYAGVIQQVPTSGPYLGQIAVLVGMPGAYAPSDQSGAVQRVTTDIPLGTITAQTSGTAFNVGGALPANARVLAAEINVISEV